MRSGHGSRRVQVRKAVGRDEEAMGMMGNMSDMDKLTLRKVVRA